MSTENESWRDSSAEEQRDGNRDGNKEYNKDGYNNYQNSERSSYGSREGRPQRPRIIRNNAGDGEQRTTGYSRYERAPRSSYNREEGSSSYNRSEGSSYNREGGSSYNRSGGSYNREGGSSYNRSSYNRDGGSSYNRNSGGSYNRDGGSSYNRDGSSYNRDGGSSYNREGGSYNREGGSYNREGGSSYNREGGNSYNREGGSSYNREGGNSSYRPRYNRDNNGGERSSYSRPQQRSYNNNGGGERRTWNNNNGGERRTWNNNGGEGNSERPRYSRPGGNSGYNNSYNNNRGGGGGYRPRSYDNRSQGGYRPRTEGYDPNAKYSQKKQIEYKEQFIDPNEPIRLNKFLANAGVCSRREADEFITAGVVSVNGVVVTELGTKIKRTDLVTFHEEPVSVERKVYLLLNKPKDCVTTSDDPQSRLTVMDLVKGACNERIYPVGRLDRNTTGVLLLTNDGDLASKLTHPQYLKKKIYQVQTDKNVTKNDLDQIAAGVKLEDGTEIVADAVSYADPVKRNVVGIEIHSGQNRIVRRIFEALGYRVVKLDRVYFAGLTKKGLKRGDWRYLSENEVNFLRMGSFN